MFNIIISSIIFSIWCIILFFGKEVGLSMLLYIVPLTYYLIFLLEKNNKVENKKAKILIIPITLLASTYFIFNNDFFRFLNKLAIPALIIFMIQSFYNEDFRISFSFFIKFLEVLVMPINFIGETFEKVRNTLYDKFKFEVDAKKDKNIKKVLKATIITLPVVIVIIILLASADKGFSDLFIGIFKNVISVLSKIRISNLIVKLFLIFISFVYLLNFCNYIISKYEKNEEKENRIKKKEDNFTIKMILGALNIIYLIFCIMQIKSLIQIEGDINYSSYARQGFFQLMIVSFINLITILYAKKEELKLEKTKNNYIKIMSLIMVIFTFIILISSAVRMYLYENAYGYTLLRLLVYCVLFTESIMLVPTIMYIIDKKINLVKTYFMIIVTIYVCMNFMNFDNIIARRNVDRYIETEKIDIDYLLNETGTDSLGEIIRIQDVSKDEVIKNQVKNHINYLYNELNEEKMDFRDFNLSKILSKKMIEKVIK